MDFSNFCRLLLEQSAAVSLSQWLVLVLGVTEVLLARINNIWLYPTGIVASILSVFGLFEAQLYAESLLGMYYIVMSFYGWWYWIAKRNEPVIEITYASKQDWFVVISIVSLGWLILYAILKLFTPSTVPLWDAWVTSTAWAGMWLLAKRKIENWILLNISNAFAIPLLFMKALPLYAVLTSILFLVACVGYFDWKKIANKSTL